MRNWQTGYLLGSVRIRFGTGGGGGPVRRRASSGEVPVMEAPRRDSNTEPARENLLQSFDRLRIRVSDYKNQN